MDETVRLVVEAVVDVIIVEDAYGMESAEFVGAEKVTFPFAYARAPEKVVVAVHVGMPFTNARMVPDVVEAIRANDEGEFA